MASENNGTSQTPLAKKSDDELKREAKARLRRMSPAAANEVVEEVLDSAVVAPVVGFVDFLREKAVVGLAIGFVVGTQVQGVAGSVNTNFINPLIDLIFPRSQPLLTRKALVTIGSNHAATFRWGAVVYTLLDFLFVLIALYILIKVFKFDKLDKRKQ